MANFGWNAFEWRISLIAPYILLWAFFEIDTSLNKRLFRHGSKGVEAWVPMTTKNAVAQPKSWAIVPP